MVFLGSAMAKKLDMIKDIDGKRETLKLGVRVVDHWYVQSRDSTLQLEMILMDENVSISSLNIWVSFWMSYVF